MFAKLTRSVLVASVVTSTLGACGSHVGDVGGALPSSSNTVRDPDNPYWPSRPFVFDGIDPARGPGMR
jgi:hypothetical protein